MSIVKFVFLSSDDESGSIRYFRVDGKPAMGERVIVGNRDFVISDVVWETTQRGERGVGRMTMSVICKEQ